MLQLDSRREREPLAGEVVDAAVARRGEGDGSRAGLRRAHQLLEIIEARRDLREIEHRRVAHHGDRHEVALELVGHVVEERGIHGELAGVRHEQRIAVGRRLRHRGGGDEAIAAGAVLDHKIPSQALVHLLAEDARAGVDRPARRKGDEDPDRLARIVLRHRQRRRCGEHHSQDALHDCLRFLAASFTVSIISG